MLQLDLDNNTRNRMYHMKNSWVENVSNQYHTNWNCFDIIQKMLLLQRKSFRSLGEIMYSGPDITITLQ